MYLRYRLVSDGSQTGDGAYVDDVDGALPACDLLRERVRVPAGHLDGDAARHGGGRAGVGAEAPARARRQVKDALLQGVDREGVAERLVATGGRLNLARTLDKVSLIAGGHVRPKGARPLRVLPRTRLHGVCVAQPGARARRSRSGRAQPPVQRSTQLTVGTPDANGPAANSVGSLRDERAPGEPGDAGRTRRTSGCR